MKTYKILGYAGLLPFLCCLVLLQSPQPYLVVEPSQAFTFYSAVILSFIAGTLWRKDNVTNKRAQIISNVICLYVFVCLFLPKLAALIFLSFGYLLLFIAEYLLCNTKDDADTQEYLKMRFSLTIIVSLLQ